MAPTGTSAPTRQSYATSILMRNRMGLRTRWDRTTARSLSSGTTTRAFQMQVQHRCRAERRAARPLRGPITVRAPLNIPSPPHPDPHTSLHRLRAGTRDPPESKQPFIYVSDDAWATFKDTSNAATFGRLNIEIRPEMEHAPFAMQMNKFDTFMCINWHLHHVQQCTRRRM